MERWQELVRQAVAQGTTLMVQGHGSKAEFLGADAGTELLSTGEHAGVVRYQPEELVVTVRSGTSLNELEQVLGERDQMLAFEPPRFGGRGTVGGCVAAGASGPARPWWGAVRDAVLGVRLINGLGEDLRFGGEVMKNVAGFDVSRLQCGAFGTLGVLTEVSLRVAPRPMVDQTFCRPAELGEAIEQMRAWARQPLPLAGLAWVGGQLFWRLAGHPAAVDALAAEGQAADPDIWQQLHTLNHPALTEQPVRRQDVAPASAPAPGTVAVSWGGALRWITAASSDQGTLIGTRPQTPAALDALTQRVQRAFDPHGVFNRAARYED